MVFSRSINWIPMGNHPVGKGWSILCYRQTKLHEKDFRTGANSLLCLFRVSLAEESRRAFLFLLGLAKGSPALAWGSQSIHSWAFLSLVWSWLEKLQHSWCFPSIQLLCPETNPSLSQGMSATALQRSAQTGCLENCAINRVEKGEIQLLWNWFS